MHSEVSLSSPPAPIASLTFIRALEEHRSRRAVQPLEARPLSDELLATWIHHDSMVEGRLFRRDEIVVALAEDDQSLDRYLHPLMKDIRRYRDAVRFIYDRAASGQSAVRIENLKAIHRMLTPRAKDRGGQYRLTSPVHRDYFQTICPADKVSYHLRKLFEQIREECDTACDPVAFAAAVHHRLMHIYPFRRNPGTTARLFTNLLLLSRGYPPAIIPAAMRQEYYHALRKPDPTDLARIYSRVVAAFLQRWDQASA